MNEDENAGSAPGPLAFTKAETEELRRWLREAREKREHRDFYSTERHWRNTAVYWVTPYDSEADKETEPAKPMVIQQEGQGVRILLGGFDSEPDIPDLHVELRPNGTWSVQVRPDQGDPMFYLEIDKLKGHTQVVSDGLFNFEELDHRTILVRHLRPRLSRLDHTARPKVPPSRGAAFPEH